MEIGTYYMTSLTCEYCRALIERCVEGGYGFLDCIFDAYACSQMADANDNIEKLHLCGADDPDFVKLIESAGAYVCADRYCFGAFPGREEIALNETEDVLTQICRHNVMHCQCPRYMDKPRIDHRKAYLDALAREYKADGIIVEQMNFCNFWPYERAALFHIMPEEFGWPVLSVDRPYIVGASGQMRTRVQAFVESVEMKKLRRGEQC